MTSTQLPPLNFGGALRASSLFAPLSVDDLVSTELIKPTGEADLPEVLQEPEQPVESSLSTTVAPSSPKIPVHPIPSLQEAFSESLDEATNGSPGDKPSLRDLDARGRRDALIAQDRDDEPFDAKWRYRDGQQQHELVKLLSQISFGVYLLLNGMANSKEQVVNILQGHIDEVDEFLEVALEDLSEAIDDLNGRIDYLKLPLANVQVFEQLLEDRNFRLEILEGNEKIDHVISRTNAAMKQWSEDAEAGLHSAAAFTSWLSDEENADWIRQRPDVADILDAMKCNTEGWLSAFDNMSDRVQEASNVIMRLSTIIGEMEKKAGEVSRRTWASIQPFSLPSLRSHGASGSNLASSLSGTSSRQSKPMSSHKPQLSVQSVGASTRSGSTADSNPVEEFPLPGGVPLLPPPRSELRPGSSDYVAGLRMSKGTHSKSSSLSKHDSKLTGGTGHSPSVVDEPLYVLQPHIYSPQPPAGSMSPRVKLSSSTSDLRLSTSASNNPLGVRGHGLHQRKASIRSRVSQKTSLPDAIRIPPLFSKEPLARGSALNLAAPQPAQSYPLDSAYGSDGDSITQPVASEHSVSPPQRPMFTHSPQSDTQYYRPVRASPHSPLQQRPHTAVGNRAPSQMHLSHRPSAMGGVSTLSNVTNAASEEDGRTRTSRTRTTGGTLKKKKSAFGWFKKAFSLDEDEKAAFEARKAMRQGDQYYNSDSPKFLDGRRIK